MNRSQRWCRLWLRRRWRRQRRLLLFLAVLCLPLGALVWRLLRWVAGDPFLGLGLTLAVGSLLGLCFVLGPFARFVEGLADSIFMPGGVDPPSAPAPQSKSGPRGGGPPSQARGDGSD